MTGGDDILYLITLRNLEIHLVIRLCCFEVCFWDRAFNWLAMVLITLNSDGIETEPTNQKDAIKNAVS